MKWLQNHWNTPKFWDFFKQGGSLLFPPSPDSVAESDLLFRADIPLADGSKKTRNQHWKSFANWINDLYLPSSSAPFDTNQIAKWIRTEHAGDASVKDLISTVKCRCRQLSLVEESASDFYLTTVLTKRITSAYGSSKTKSKAPPITPCMLRAVTENRLYKILSLWMNSSLRVSGWLSLDAGSIPNITRLKALYKGGQRFINLRVHKDKTSVYFHLCPIKPIVNALSGIPLMLPVVEKDLQEIKKVFSAYKLDYQEHSPRRTWCLWIRRRLHDYLRMSTQKKIKDSPYFKRINKLVGWTDNSTEFFNYSADFLNVNARDLPDLCEDIWNFVRFGNDVPEL